ncbi:MAG TPA: SDR family oxidoreductase, partial [Thermoleophilaceae bacterium]|nr:SDR family oxidoreductase [Thermoleophilaceae bacterium]
MDSGAIFLTGSSGFVGMELLARYLERTDRTVYALIRASDDEEAGRRVHQAARTVVPDADAYAHRLVAVRGDVTQPDLGLDSRTRRLLAEEVTDVVHSAASVSFNLPIDQAREINLHGSRRILDFAELCARRGDGLRRLAHVSTAYVAGNHRGRFHEHDLDCRQRFNNSYELSKWEAERLVRSRSERIPITVFRPSIVVGEHDSGWTPAFNVVYGPLRAYSRGSLTLVPGRRSAPADVVPVDYVADSVFELSSRPDTAAQTFTLAAGPEARSVGQLIEMSAAAFGRRRAVALHPRVYGRAVHPLLVRRGSAKRRKALKRAEVYFPYFDVGARFDTSAATEALAPAGIRVPPLESYFDALVRFAKAADWGKRPITRVEARREA